MSGKVLAAVPEAEYRKQLRAEFEDATKDSNETHAFKEASWRYICALEGIPPEGP